MATTRVVTPERKSPTYRVRLNPSTPPFYPSSLIVESPPQNSYHRKSYAAVVKSRAAPDSGSPLGLAATEWPPLQTPATSPPPPPKTFERKGAREPPDIIVKHRRKRRRRRKSKNSSSPPPSTRNSTELDHNPISDLADIVDGIHQATLESYKELLKEMIGEMKKAIVKELKTALRKAIDFQNSKMSRSIKNIRIDFEKFQYSVSQQLRALKAPRATQNAAGKRKKSKKRPIIEKEGDIDSDSECESISTLDIVTALGIIFGEEEEEEEGLQSECSECGGERTESDDASGREDEESANTDLESEQRSATEIDNINEFFAATENTLDNEIDDFNHQCDEYQDYEEYGDDGNESFWDDDGFYHATDDY